MLLKRQRKALCGLKSGGVYVGLVSFNWRALVGFGRSIFILIEVGRVVTWTHAEEWQAWTCLESQDYSLLVSQDTKNTFEAHLKKKRGKEKNFATLSLDLLWFDIFVQGSLPHLSSYLWLNQVLFVFFFSSRIRNDLCIWFYIQGENTRLSQRYSITTQLLVLYYVLSYEEALLANTKILGMCECVMENRLTGN